MIKLPLNAQLTPERIVTDPTATSEKFVLLGKSEGQSVAIHIDLHDNTRPQCKNDTQNADASDFELWSLTNINQDTCVFGPVR